MRQFASGFECDILSVNGLDFFLSFFFMGRGRWKGVGDVSSGPGQNLKPVGKRRFLAKTNSSACELHVPGRGYVCYITKL